MKGLACWGGHSPGSGRVNTEEGCEPGVWAVGASRGLSSAHAEAGGATLGPRQCALGSCPTSCLPLIFCTHTSTCTCAAL